MTEVERRQVEEIDYQENLGPEEVAADEQHDESKVEEIVEDEMASNSSCSLDAGSVTRK